MTTGRKPVDRIVVFRDQTGQVNVQPLQAVMEQSDHLQPERGELLGEYVLKVDQ